MATFRDRLRAAWNVFVNGQQQVTPFSPQIGPGTGTRPDRTLPRIFNDKTIVASVYTRIAIDVAGIMFKHVEVDDIGRYSKDMDSPLNDCLTIEPNLDQGPRHFRQDITMTMFDKGSAAIVPVDTADTPNEQSMVDIFSLRVGNITQWYPKHVRVLLYNEAKGRTEEVVLPKRTVAIVENPLYLVMNAPNSTLQRLIRKLQLLDIVDEQSSSGKLDIILQLPYVIKTEVRKQQAEQRRKDIEFQLKGSQYGIAYTDGTEKITQLNRPAENNLLKQVEYLVNMLYGQLGITPEVMNGTADEATMLNYLNRTVEPIADAIREAMHRSFIGLVGTKLKQAIMYFRNPFKLVPLAQFADIADKLSRNEIVTPNEIRIVLGFQPHPDPKADKLINSNNVTATNSDVQSLERNTSK